MDLYAWTGKAIHHHHRPGAVQFHSHQSVHPDQSVFSKFEVLKTFLIYQFNNGNVKFFDIAHVVTHYDDMFYSGFQIMFLQTEGQLFKNCSIKKVDSVRYYNFLTVVESIYNAWLKARRTFASALVALETFLSTVQFCLYRFGRSSAGKKMPTVHLQGAAHGF